MQSRPQLQEEAVDVVINSLVRQTGSYVTWRCLPACSNTVPATDVSLTRCHHLHRCFATRHSLSSPCLGMTGHSHDFSVSRGRSQEHWPPVLPLLCGVYGSGDYMTFILLKMRFCAWYMRMRVICICGVYAYAGYMCENTVYINVSVMENTVYISVSVTETCHGAGNWQTADVCRAWCGCRWVATAVVECRLSWAALGQVMLYVDGMNGVIAHNATVQWLYSLINSAVSTFPRCLAYWVPFNGKFSHIYLHQADVQLLSLNS